MHCYRSFLGLLRAFDASPKGGQPPRPPQQLSIKKPVSRFTLAKFAEYVIERPFLLGSINSAAANTFR